jgi:hypothetical protein
LIIAFLLSFAAFAGNGDGNGSGNGNGNCEKGVEDCDENKEQDREQKQDRSGKRDTPPGQGRAFAGTFFMRIIPDESLAAVPVQEEDLMGMPGLISIHQDGTVAVVESVPGMSPALGVWTKTGPREIMYKHVSMATPVAAPAELMDGLPVQVTAVVEFEKGLVEAYGHYMMQVLPPPGSMGPEMPVTEPVTGTVILHRMMFERYDNEE